MVHIWDGYCISFVSQILKKNFFLHLHQIWTRVERGTRFYPLMKYLKTLYCGVLFKIKKKQIFSRLNFGTLLIGSVKLSKIFSQSSGQIFERNEKIKKTWVVDGFQVTGYKNPENSPNHRFGPFLRRQIIKIVKNG